MTAGRTAAVRSPDGGVRSLATLRHLVRDIHNEHRLDRLAGYFPAGYAEHDPRVGADPGRFWREFLTVFPDLTVSLDLALDDGDQVMAFLTWRGHEAGTGRDLALRTSELFHIVEGRVLAHGAVVDYCELGVFGFTPRRTTFPCDPALRGPHTDAERANVQVVLSSYDEVMTRHRLDRADAYYWRDYVHHNEQMPAVPNGVEAFKEYFAGNFARYPDLAVTPDQVLARGDLVMVFATWRGTFTGVARGREPTGRKLLMRTSDLFRLAGGRVVEHWEVVDYSGLQRVGLPIRPYRRP